VTWTDAAPTVAKLYGRIADALNQIHASRFEPPTHVVMHPRRWAWMLAASDSTGRPLVSPTAGSTNALATASDAPVSGGPVGRVLGLDVVVDALVLTNVGTNQDQVLLVRAPDVLLWESSIRTGCFPRWARAR
jgi:hypothetical protein